MPLTKRQLDALLKAIDTRFLSITYEALGEIGLDEDEIEKLKRLGLLRRGTRHMVVDPSAFGKFSALLPPSVRASLTYATVEKMIREGKYPMTGVEKRAVEYATEHAGQYIRGIKDMALKETRAEASRASMTALRAVQEGTKEAISNRQTISEFKTRLFDMLDDSGRDWTRVAHTEMNNAVQNGVYREIRRESKGEDQLVFKRPAPDACPHCNRIYLQADGITPKVFKMKDLKDSNVGLKAKDWGPTIGSVHPYCKCQLSVVPEGYSFVKMNVVDKPFEHDGKKYKSGERLSDEKYEGLSSEDKAKTRKDAILSYTGETARRAT